MSDYDLAVVGGGPAGAAAAWAARRAGLRVVLLECDSFPRDRVCGEFLSPEILPTLAEAIPPTLAEAPAIARVEFVSPRGLRRGFDLRTPARGLSRRRLDAALWQAALAAGAEGLSGARVTGISPDGPVNGESANRRPPNTFTRVQFETAGEQRSVSARHVVVAAGRWWNISGLRGPIASFGSERDATTCADPGQAPAPRTLRFRWTGVKAHFSASPGTLAGPLEMHYFTGGYCGLCRVEGGAINACCLIRHEIAGRLSDSRDFAPWIAGVSRHAALRERLRALSQCSPTVVTTVPLLGHRSAAEGGCLFAGDASGFLDPAAGDGLARAIGSGTLAAGIIARHCAALAAGGCRASSDAAGTLMTTAAVDYERRLNDAVRGSYGAAGRLRWLVRLPPPLQELSARFLFSGSIGRMLLQQTRWRETA
jgi:flavin-dependent dehydrogenase